MSVWDRVALSEIATSVNYGVTASATGQPVGPKFLRITDIQNGTVDWDQVPWCECDNGTAAEARLEHGDIVFARTGATTGKSFLIRDCPPNAVFASYLIRVRLGDRADPRYVSHYFHTSDYWAQIIASARGVAQPGVNASTLKALTIPLPSLLEQRRIAEILDRAEAVRVKRRETLARLDTLTQSFFLDLFGDPEDNPKRLRVARLEDVCERVTDGTHQPPEWADAGHPFLFVSNIISGEISFDTEKFISDETHAMLTRRCPIEVGDVLYSTVGSYGVPALVRTTKKFSFQRHIAHIKPNPKYLSSEFLRAMLASPPLRRQADRAARGVAQKTLNLADLSRFVVFCPPLNVQEEFAKTAVAIGRVKTTYQGSLAELDALFASLQYRAFRGEL